MLLTAVFEDNHASQIAVLFLAENGRQMVDDRLPKKQQ
jgi:hypothetical protein